MKRLKYILAILTIVSSQTYMRAQDYKIPVENTKDIKLTLDDFMGSLPIEGYEGKEIIITPTVFSPENTSLPAKSKGLKQVYPYGTDNTNLGLDVEKNGNQVHITCLAPLFRKAEYKIRVPNNLALKIESGCERQAKISIRDMNNEIEITACLSINLKNIHGPLVLANINGDITVENLTSVKDEPISIATISGNIKIQVNELTAKQPITITTISGEIDLSLPVKTSANLVISTISGGVYSDFDLSGNNKQGKKGESNVNTLLNGGGFDLTLTTISGNIYLRKK
jgi:lia operon protein LiaG